MFLRILASGGPTTRPTSCGGAICFAILNAFPYTNGHLLVMPYREVGELEDLTADEHAELWAAVPPRSRAEAAYRPTASTWG